MTIKTINIGDPFKTPPDKGTGLGRKIQKRLIELDKKFPAPGSKRKRKKK